MEMLRESTLEGSERSAFRRSFGAPFTPRQCFGAAGLQTGNSCRRAAWRKTHAAKGGRLSLTAPCLRLRLVFEIFDGLQVAFLGGGENIIKG
jgi:hypothetical protein